MAISRCSIRRPSSAARGHPSEDPDLDGEELELEIDLHQRGWRMCECYSRYVPEGEFGHIAEGRLLPLPERDFDEALSLLREQDLPEYEELVYNAVARYPLARSRLLAQAESDPSVAKDRTAIPLMSRLHRSRFG